MVGSRDWRTSHSTQNNIPNYINLSNIYRVHYITHYIYIVVVCFSLFLFFFCPLIYPIYYGINYPIKTSSWYLYHLGCHFDDIWKRYITWRGFQTGRLLKHIHLYLLFILFYIFFLIIYSISFFFFWSLKISLLINDVLYCFCCKWNEIKLHRKNVILHWFQ